jgi:TPR repeat protein
LLRQAARQGNAAARFLLGTLYAQGEGVTRDLPAALRWYRKAAEQGHRGAQYNLAVMLAKGEGTAQDLDEAATWFAAAGALPETETIA